MRGGGVIYLTEIRTSTQPVPNSGAGAGGVIRVSVLVVE
jgi:hypothetical protein